MSYLYVSPSGGAAALPSLWSAMVANASVATCNAGMLRHTIEASAGPLHSPCIMSSQKQPPVWQPALGRPPGLSAGPLCPKCHGQLGTSSFKWALLPLGALLCYSA